MAIFINLQIIAWAYPCSKFDFFGFIGLIARSTNEIKSIHNLLSDYKVDLKFIYCLTPYTQLDMRTELTRTIISLVLWYLRIILNLKKLCLDLL